MPNDPHTQRPPIFTNASIIGGVPNFVWTLALAAITAFGASWFNTQLMQNTMQNRLERTEERQEALAARVSENATTAQANSIRLAEIAVSHAAMLEQIKELKANQERLVRMK